MFLNYRQFSLISSISLLLANPALAGGGNLSVSPDQKTKTPQLQLNNGGDDGNTMKTMSAETQQVTMEQNAGLNQVSSDSHFIFEVPVKIKTANGKFGPEWGEYEGDTMQFKISCSVNPRNSVDTDHHYGDWKTIHLGSDGKFDGTVRVGVQVTEGYAPHYKFEYNSYNDNGDYGCFLRPAHPEDGVMDSDNGNWKGPAQADLDLGAAYNLYLSGDFEYPDDAYGEPNF